MPIPESFKTQLQQKQKVPSYLNLSGRGVTDSDIPELVRLIKINPCITSLDLSRCPITENSAQALLDLDLQHLHAGYTHIGDAGAIKLLSSRKFPSIFLNNCALTDAVEKSVLDNDALLQIDISGNRKISEDVKRNIRDHVRDNKEKSNKDTENSSGKLIEEETKESTSGDSKKNTELVSSLIKQLENAKDAEKNKILRELAKGLKTIGFELKEEQKAVSGQSLNIFGNNKK